MEFSLNQIATATGGTIVRAEDSADRPLRIVTDSREAAPDTIFWAMHGTAHDGHEFVDAALANGAAACVVSAAWAAQEEGAWETPLITVADTLQALAALAAWNRQRWPVRVIGITGSFGKTTTREMVHAVLSQKFESLRSPKNFNNQFGVPLTLLQLKPHHDVAVVELGASACGEIRRLAQIAQPDTGIITGTGFAHAAQFGGQKAVVRAKGELAEAIPGRGLLLLCGDEESANAHAARASCRVLRVGTSSEKESVNNLIASEVVQAGDKLQVTIGETVFEVAISGRHFARSVLFAVAIARDLGMTDDEIQLGLNNFDPVAGRCEIRQLPACTVIDDCYNSSPEAMQAAIAVLAGRESSGQRILITGDMLMLGEHGSTCHRDIGVTAAASGIDHVFAIGRFANDVVDGAVEAGFDPERATAHVKLEELLERLNTVLSDGDVILVKGSRATHMERVVDWLIEQSTANANDNQPADRETSTEAI
ncbi:MAG: UDP-N-acetylmuramoyl-tripeptide--D-alanyl-D-alanine ligase [Planctomycetota bacterium]|nr:UDP-N-acetylmuramoyl-tripeptide--D-alanyl-D-alanine ligase [Planctomycetota bacterium]